MDEKFRSIVAGILKIDPSRLDRGSTSESIPEWDSLTHWMVIGSLEDTYNIEFTMDEATEFNNLGDIYDTLMSKLSQG